MVQWRAFLLRRIGDEIKEIEQPEYTTKATVGAWREILERTAIRLWGGREGRDWRIVQDDTVIGFHAVRVADGEVIEIR